MKSAVILEDRGVLAVSGSEWRDFLQNLVSNDIDTLTPQHAIYAALLTPQGKYLFDFIMIEQENGVLLDTDRARLPDLLRRLMMYKLRADVTLEDQSETWRVVALLDAADGLSDQPGACTAQGGAVLVTDPRDPALGVRALLPASMTLESIGYEAVDPARYESRRISLGIPASGTDLVVDKTLLMEADFERLNGVSFTKGCYIGQELTARTKHRGNVRRRLYPVSIDAEVDPGTEVTLEGKSVGEIRTIAGQRAIAFLRIEDVERAAQEGLLMVAATHDVKVETPKP